MTVLGKVVDVATISSGRGIKKPKLILGSDGGQDKLFVTAIVKEDSDTAVQMMKLKSQMILR